MRYSISTVRKKIVIDEVPSSSLVAFSQFKREVLQNDVSGDVLARLPKIKPAIEFEKLNDEVQCFQVSLPEDIKGDDVYLLQFMLSHSVF